MKRDLELIRRMLLTMEAFEQFDSPSVWPALVEACGAPEDVLEYHVILLHEAGLIDAIDLGSGDDGPSWVPMRLTWDGHEFLDAARSETVWGKAKKIVAEKGVGMSFDVLKALLSKLTTDLVMGG